MIFENEANLYKHVLKIYKNPQNWWEFKKNYKNKRRNLKIYSDQIFH